MNTRARPLRYFYDCEFIEDGRTIDLVSLGMVCEDGREFYAVSTEFDESRAGVWVRKHVLAQLPKPSDPAWRSRAHIRDDLYHFLTAPGRPVQLWAWVAAYDHVALAQLWGDMTKLPGAVPRLTYEVRQYWELAGSPKVPNPPEGRHHALTDARLAQARFLAAEQALRARRR